MPPTTPEPRTATHAKARTDDQTRTGAGASEHPLIPAGRVNGTDVYNQAHEKIGRIEDIALDKRSGRVAYAILSFGGLWGMGEKHHPPALVGAGLRSPAARLRHRSDEGAAGTAAQAERQRP